MIKPDLIISSKGLGVKTISFMTTKLLEDELIELKQVKNRKKINKDFVTNLIEKPVIWMNQEHGNIALEASNQNIERTVNADALYSKEKGLAIAVETADCLPIILSSNVGSEIAAIHAGWRGLSGGIIESTLKLFTTRLENVSAWLAPCISAKNYEVGKDVFEIFEARGLEHFFIPNPIQEKWYLDLQWVAQNILQDHGLTVNSTNLCTFDENHLFHSYRRDKTLRRMSTIVWNEE